MSTYTSFEEKLLVGAYQITEDLGIDVVSVREVIDRYDLQPKQNWIMRALIGFEKTGLSKGYLTLGESLDQDIRLTSQGVKEAERLKNDENVWVPTQEEKRAIDEALGVSYPQQEASIMADQLAPVQAIGTTEKEPRLPLNPNSQEIESDKWTGKQHILIDAKAISQVKDLASKLHVEIHNMHFTSNSDSHNLKGLADALVAVCSMAEPEITILDRILASPKFKAYAGIAALIATIRGVLGI